VIRKKNPQAVFTPEEIVRLASQHRNYFPPGHGWKYSNTNYVLAGMIIQKVMKQPVEVVMNHYLHGGSKLNLANTFYLARMYTAGFIARMAHGYSSDGHDVTRNNMSWANTAGAIVTTSEDLLTWWHGLFRNNILPPQEMAQMMSLVCEGTSKSCVPGEHIPHLYDDEVGKGYGLGIIQSAYGSSKIGTVWWHNGSTKGYKAIVMWYPKSNIYMSLIINRDPGYLLKPNLPAIRRILNILMSDTGGTLTNNRISYRKKVKHFFQQHLNL
jgi:D-alanyl-D-alanine carboxypeptidase